MHRSVTARSHRGSPLSNNFNLNTALHVATFGRIRPKVAGQPDVNYQGWIKGLNSSALVPDKDMGKDGTSTSTATQRVARDAYGYTIGYYDGDYAPIGGSGVKFEVNTTGSAFLANSTRLYNGNISHIAQHNKKTGNAWGQLYLYDQLHRIKRMTSWDNVDLGT